MIASLSAYEQKRYRRIQRNERKLRELGLSTKRSPLGALVDAPTGCAIPQALRPKQPSTAPAKPTPKPKPKPSRKSKRARSVLQPPTRRSSRLRRSPAEAEAASVTAPAVKAALRFSYERLPITIDDVDDIEFLAFAELKKWRLIRSRELEFEAYKIFQNRSLLEFVRRRRNDAMWAAQRTHAEQLADLEDVWGVGPSKAMEGGFAGEAIAVLSGEAVAALLGRSRTEAPGRKLVDCDS